MADRAKDRPFYELPSTYKSCSTIIQETRRQLSSKSLERAGSSASNPSSRENSAGASSCRHVDLRNSLGDEDFDEVPDTNSHARPVYTQRPKTGIEHDMSTFWGVSSRKRPPSAITLSRLSLMDSSSEDDTSVAVQNISSQVENLQLAPNEVAREDPLLKLQSAINDLKTCMGKSVGAKVDLVEALKKVDQEICGEAAAESKLKSKLLKLVFKLVERYQQDEDVLFWASSILMKCKVEGSTNLATVFKLVFKASRSKAYWACMVESDYLDSFMCCFAELNAVDQIECLIYGYGTLKFLCVDKAILQKLLSLGLIPVMTLHLKSLNVGRQGEVCDRSGDVLNGLFQLTSIFRSIVGEEPTLGEVVDSGLLIELLECLSWALEDIDVLSNIVRILSVVSGSALCCDCISASRSVPGSVLQVLDLWYSKEDVVVRLCYCLGNVLAVSDRMRLVLFDQKKTGTGPSFLSKLVKVIHYYLERFNSPSSEDVLIKSIRVLANWSLNPMIGTEVGESANVMDLLNVVLKNSDQQFSDELLMCAVGTLNNVSYYKDFEQLDSRCVLTSQYLLGYVNSWTNAEGVVEALRVLGNLTRNCGVRAVVAEHVGVIVRHLGKRLEQEESVESNEAVAATLGLLMNVIVVEEALKGFGEYGGMSLVVKVIEGRGEVEVHLMACQFLWNFIMAALGVEDGGGGGGALKGWDQETRLKLHKVLGQRLKGLKKDQLKAVELEESCFDVGQEFEVIGKKVWERLGRDLEEDGGR